VTPIEQVKPALPGNWPRRVENRNKKGGGDRPQPGEAKEERPPRHGPDDRPDAGDHIVDELA
jgi:hypothetical protein